MSEQSLKQQFGEFAKFGALRTDGKSITLTQSDKWMKQAKVIDEKITTTDTAIHFKKLKSLKLEFAQYNKFLRSLAEKTKVELPEIKKKLGACGAPGVSLSKKTGSKVAAAVKRLTDVSKYTGSHKERFDEISKRRGIGDREDIVKNDSESEYKQEETIEEKTIQKDAINEDTHHEMQSIQNNAEHS